MWRIETLAGKHDRSQFDCGEEDLNTWLRQHASQSDKRHATLTRVLTGEGDDVVRGYYSQCSYRLDGLELEALYGADDKPRYAIPSVLLARLARCESVRGEGVGEILLAHALRACTEVSERVGLQMVVVHAINERAAEFYETYGFVRFVDHPNSLMMPVKTLKAEYPS